MKTLQLIAFLAFVWLLTFQGQAATDDLDRVAGKWSYSAPTAPFPYTSGKIVLKKINNTLSAELIVNGTRMIFNSVSFENDELKMEVEIEYNLVKVTFKLVDGQLVGEASWPEGPVKVKASKID